VSTEPDEMARLERYLIAQGAEPDELREAGESGTLGTLALELALRSPGERIPFDEAVRRAGVEPDDAAALWRALGFPDPRESSVNLGESGIETLQILGEFGRRLGAETTLQLARVIGGAVAVIAEAIVDAFRVNVEMPRHSAGDPYPEVVEDYASAAAVAIPALGRAMTDALGAHLVSVSGSTWGLDSERATITRERTVGFADLVGYTASVRTASPATLAATISRFEGHVGEVVARFGGRVVKLIGDEAMFIVSDPVAACELALELNRTLAADPRLPSVGRSRRDRLSRTTATTTATSSTSPRGW
jgi:adenylate cyclase